MDRISKFPATRYQTVQKVVTIHDRISDYARYQEIWPENWFNRVKNQTKFKKNHSQRFQQKSFIRPFTKPDIQP